MSIILLQSPNPSAVFAVSLPADSKTACGANPIILGLPLEEANFRFRLPYPHATCYLQPNVRMELELRDHIYRLFTSSQFTTVRR